MSDDQLLRRVSEEYRRVPGYLDTAAVGLPTRRTLAVMERRLDEWEAGACVPQSFDPDVAAARAAFARIVEVGPDAVAIAGAVSPVAGMVASSLPGGARVLVAEEDFTSVLFPFLENDRLEVVTVPLAEIVDRVDDSVDLVAVSAVQSSSGIVTDLDALADAAARHDTRTFVDVTQAAGWLPIGAGRFDVTACHAYKWLCCPRGAGFLTVGAGAMEWLRPIDAGWYAGENPWTSIYGPPLRLASDARRFDTSPAWFSFAASVPALELLADLGAERIGAHAVGLANRFRQEVGHERSDSAIVSLDVGPSPRFDELGVKVSSRAGRARLSFHLYSTDEDVDLAVAAVRG